MKKFRTRLKYYLIGFGLGIVFMFLIFGNRACSWLPENRVKNMIAEKEIFIGDSLDALMKCQGVSNEDIYRFLNEDGDIDFGNSDTEGSPKRYLFEGTKDNEPLTISYMLYDEYVEIVDFEYDQNNCETDLRNNNKTVVPLPNSEVITIIESKEMRFLEEAECQMDCYGLTKEQVQVFHLSADVDMSQTKPKLQPNPYYTMVGKIGNQVYSITYIIGESRTRISNISADQACDCR